MSDTLGRASSDGADVEQLLVAVQPVALEASLAAVAGVDRVRCKLERQWEQKQKRERAA